MAQLPRWPVAKVAKMAQYRLVLHFSSGDELSAIKKHLYPMYRLPSKSLFKSITIAALEQGSVCY